MIDWLKKDNHRWCKVIGGSAVLAFMIAVDLWWYIYLGHPYP